MSTKIGTAIREARQAAGVPEITLAKQARLDRGVIELQHIERGIALPDHYALFRIANQFPDIDSTAWVWLLAEDLWGEPVADAMKAYAVAEHAAQQAGGDPDA